MSCVLCLVSSLVSWSLCLVSCVLCVVSYVLCLVSCVKCVVFGGGWDVAVVWGRLSGVWCVVLCMTCAVCSCMVCCIVYDVGCV